MMINAASSNTSFQDDNQVFGSIWITMVTEEQHHESIPQRHGLLFQFSDEIRSAEEKSRDKCAERQRKADEFRNRCDDQANGQAEQP